MKFLLLIYCLVVPSVVASNFKNPENLGNANTRCEHSPLGTTWRNDFGSNVTFIISNGILDGCFSSRNASGTGSSGHYPLRGFIIYQNDIATLQDAVISAIISWTVSWRNNDSQNGMTNWIGYISDNVLYTNSTLILLENFTSTFPDIFHLQNQQS